MQYDRFAREGKTRLPDSQGLEKTAGFKQCIYLNLVPISEIDSPFAIVRVRTEQLLSALQALTEEYASMIRA